MASKLARPARRITPAGFYTEFLPALWNDAVDGLALPWPDWRFEIGITVTADAAPEHFTLAFARGTLSGRAGAPAASPLFAFSCDLEAWRVSVRQPLVQTLDYTEQHFERAEKGLGGFLRRRGGQLSESQLRQLPGAVHIDYTDDAGDRFHYELTVAGGGGPVVRIEANDADLAAVLEAGAHVARLLRSRLQVQGDVGYLLKLASLALPEG